MFKEQINENSIKLGVMFRKYLGDENNNHTNDNEHDPYRCQCFEVWMIQQLSQVQVYLQHINQRLIIAEDEIVRLKKEV
jgi:hypothetical protein